jgi:glycosyltransferase involved in cell wall biosynthesis
MQAGEADHALNICRQLGQRGLEVHVLTTKGYEESVNEPFSAYPVMSDWSWSDLPRLIRFVKRCSPDVIFLIYIGLIYNYHPMMTFAPTICRALCPHVRFVTLFEYPLGWAPSRWSILTRGVRRAVERWASRRDVDYEFGSLLRDSDSLVVLSNYHRDKLARRWPEVRTKSVLVPPPPLLRMSPENGGISRHRTREKLGLAPNDFLIAYFGYIYPPKGVETLFKAFQIVSSQRNNVWLILIGGVLAREYSERPSYAREMRELPKQLGIEQKVIWIGEYATDSDEASLFLRAADTCVFAHDSGVYLNNSSFAAAAAHGLPIVATQGSMLEEPFIDRENVLLCPPKSPEPMAAAIMAILDDPDLKKRLHQGSLRLASEWFSWEKAIDRIVQTFSAHQQ